MNHTLEATNRAIVIYVCQHMLLGSNPTQSLLTCAKKSVVFLWVSKQLYTIRKHFLTSPTFKWDFLVCMASWTQGKSIFLLPEASSPSAIGLSSGSSSRGSALCRRKHDRFIYRPAHWLEQNIDSFGNMHTALCQFLARNQMKMEKKAYKYLHCMVLGSTWNRFTNTCM